MPSPCTGCGSATTSPTKFLLVCRQCGRPWHHRCHRPPVSDKELIQIIGLFNKARAASDSTPKTLPWTCGACVKGKAPAAAPVASGSATSGAIPAIRTPIASGSGAPPAPRPEQAPGPKGAPKAKAPSPIVIDDDSDDDIVLLENPPPALAPARTHAPTVPAPPTARLQAISPLAAPGARAPQPQPQPSSGRPASNSAQIGTKSTSRAPATRPPPGPGPGPTQGARPPTTLVSSVIPPSSLRAEHPFIAALAPARSMSAVSRTLVPALDGLSMQQHSQEPACAPVRTPAREEEEEEARYRARTKMHPQKSAMRGLVRTNRASGADVDEDKGGASTTTEPGPPRSPRVKHHPWKSARNSMRTQPMFEDDDDKGDVDEDEEDDENSEDGASPTKNPVLQASPRVKHHPRKSARNLTRTQRVSEDEGFIGDGSDENARTNDPDDNGSPTTEPTPSSSSPRPRYKHHPWKSARNIRLPEPMPEDDEDEQVDQLLPTPAPDTPAIKREAEPALRVPAAPPPPLISAWIAAHPAPDTPPDAWARAAARAHSRVGGGAKRPRKAFAVVHRPGGRVEARGGEGEGKGKGASAPFFFSADAWMRAKMVEMK
ncbi:hypothetical protein HYPSUDRAFT_34829 [Hypholoma sublateritium FD-334 SS-4]|uniref:Zinc finger PHD-type domain-containing protein n=1 Tax=Hypholoma sublateritium (strain FD-334 SS-4) TaxID=945553 RepID=A0A0D2MUR8_HYPSF|nr:hypothetical protein HYPSUDRAFT_34829 [Hypholoma sublateritium FD-334 SS-4]